MPIRDTDPRESFAPLGAPIRRGPAPTPAPRPEPIGNGMFRRPDGTLETRIPPPPAAPAMRQGMWDRDNPRSKLSPCVMATWDAAMADAGWPAPVNFRKEWRAQPVDGDMIDNGARIYCSIAGRFVPAAEWHSKLSNPPRMVADWKWPTSTECVSMSLPHGDVLGQQRADWLTITKQVRDLPSKKQEHKMPSRHAQISLKVNVFAGALVSAAAEDLCDLANRTGIMCECDFNGVKVWARPGDDPAKLVRAYDEEIQRPAHLHRVAQVPRSNRTADTEGGAKD